MALPPQVRLEPRARSAELCTCVTLPPWGALHHAANGLGHSLDYAAHFQDPRDYAGLLSYEDQVLFTVTLSDGCPKKFTAV